MTEGKDERIRPAAAGPEDDWEATKLTTVYVLALGLPFVSVIGGFHGASIHSPGAEPIVLLLVLTGFGCLPLSLLISVGVSLYAATQRKHIVGLLFALSLAHFFIFVVSVMVGRNTSF